VTRQAGSIRGVSDVSGIAMLGLEPSAVRAIDGWRGDFASRSPDELARLIEPRRSVALRGVALPASARRLAIPVRVRGTEIGITASVRQRDGSFANLDLGRNHGTKRQRLAAPIPRAARGGRLVALRFDPPPRLEERGADTGAPALGAVELGRPLGLTPHGAVAVTDYRDWIGTTGVGGLSRRGGLRFGLTLTNEVDTYVRPRQPTDGYRIPAVVSPRMSEIAGGDGLLAIEVAGQSLLFRIVAVARRFPGTASADTEDFVVSDRRTVDTALNASQPGTGFPTELWLDVAPSRRAAVGARLRRPPFDVLSVSSQARLEHELRSDPVARAALVLLEAAAVTAIVLALLGLVLGAVSERRDEAAELFDLEAQGLPPARLRRQLRLRALVVAVAGAAGGILTGLVLSVLVVGFVELTANATSPNPPLVLSLDWLVVVLSALAAAALAVALVGFATGRAFRGASPPRYGEST
jgi:hypothetical protein